MRESGVGPEGSAATTEDYADELFQSLWRLDFLSVGWDADR